MTYSRREICLLAAALAAPSGASAQEKVLSSKVFQYRDLPVEASGTNEMRPILSGKLHDGGYVELHQTRLAPGGRPHPPHHHVHEEMFLVREGTIEVTINGQSTPLGPGSVAFIGSNDEHGIRNPGARPAEYFVVAFGKDA